MLTNITDKEQKKTSFRKIDERISYVLTHMLKPLLVNCKTSGRI